MLSDIIYLDNNASTRPDPAVLEAMMRQASEGYGNPSGQHVRAAAAANAITAARRSLAELADVAPNRLFFTSGATEANNTVCGQLPASPQQRARVLLSPLEHKSVIESAHAQEVKGYQVEYLPVRDGRVDVQKAQPLFGEDVALVAVMLANNETGHLQPVAELVELSRAVGARFHCDATQALGKIPVSLTDLDVDTAAFSAHKLHGPMGIGALYVRRGLSLSPLLRGGGQQAGMRAGTENVPAIVGFGVAAEKARLLLSEAETACRANVRRLTALLRDGLPGLQVLSSETGLPNTLLIRIPYTDAEQVLAHCPGVAASTGSACATLSPEPSHVLLALYGDADFARECLRLSVSRYTTTEHITAAASQLTTAVRLVQELRATA
jgi:cysteine desulfurase